MAAGAFGASHCGVAAKSPSFSPMGARLPFQAMQDRRIPRLRIALVAPPFVRVPPVGYGGTELIIADLAAAYAASGHEVTLFATGDSHVEGCETKWLFRRPLWPPEPVAEWNHAAFAALAILDGHYDIVHSHTPALLPLVGALSVPVVHTVHLAPEPRWIDLYRLQDRARYVCISHRQSELLSEAFSTHPAVVHHGLDVERYPEGDGRDGDAIFVGRLDEVKAPHLALETARKAGVPLRIAGRPHDGDYFSRVFAPELSKGGGRLIGEICGDEKSRCIGSAKALIFSSIWEEPFGLALIEAMLCGTPVAALRKGAVPEIVDEGITGYSVATAEELPDALRAAMKLDRERVRAHARERFSLARMASAYLHLYEDALLGADRRVSLRG